MKIPSRYSPILFGAMLSAIMVSIITAIVVFSAQGLSPEYPAQWFKGFATSWPIAFPTVLLVAPFVREVIAKITV